MVANGSVKPKIPGAVAVVQPEPIHEEPGQPFQANWEAEHLLAACGLARIPGASEIVARFGVSQLVEENFASMFRLGPEFADGIPACVVEGVTEKDLIPTSAWADAASAEHAATDAAVSVTVRPSRRRRPEWLRKRAGVIATYLSLSSLHGERPLLMDR